MRGDVSHATRLKVAMKDEDGTQGDARQPGGDALWWRACAVWTYLLHDTSFALGEGDVPARLILNELDLNLPALASWLVVIIVVVVCSGTRALGASIRIGSAEGAIVAGAVVMNGRRRVLVVVGDF